MYCIPKPSQRQRKKPKVFLCEFSQVAIRKVNLPALLLCPRTSRRRHTFCSAEIFARNFEFEAENELLTL
jgi:hypothetical protein